MYGLKQSNYNFYQKLYKALNYRHIKLYSTDNYVFVSKNLILIVYINNILIFSKKKIWIDLFIKSLFEGKEKFELTDEGDINKYLSIDIYKHLNKTYKIRQLFLIQRILESLYLEDTIT